jgi:predicted peroxiredoxin
MSQATPGARSPAPVSRAAVTLVTGLEDPEKVTVALLTAVGAAESARETLMFLTKEGVRISIKDVAVGKACEGCPPITELMDRFAAAGGEFMVCPLCFNAKQLDEASLLSNARLGGTVQLWEWIGDGATTFSF